MGKSRNRMTTNERGSEVAGEVPGDLSCAGHHRASDRDREGDIAQHDRDGRKPIESLRTKRRRRKPCGDGPDVVIVGAVTINPYSPFDQPRNVLGA